MKKFAAWFTLERRDAIRLLAATLAPLLILFGLGNKDTWDQILIVVAIILQFIASLVSLLSLKKGDWTTGWTILRAAIYTAGLAIAPVLVALGVWTNDFSTQFTIGLSLFLTVLSSLVGVLVGNRQATAAAVADAKHRATPAL